MPRRKRKTFSVVKVIKEMSRERVKTPAPQVLPNKRKNYDPDRGLAKAIAARYGEDID